VDCFGVYSSCRERYHDPEQLKGRLYTMTVIYIILLTISALMTLLMLVAVLNMIATSIPLSKTSNFWDNVEDYTDKILHAVFCIFF
jgi:hypothetical protein